MATLVHTDPATGVETFSGFSWTTLFFGFIPALFRRDWIGALIGFAIALGLAVLQSGAGVGLEVYLLSWVVRVAWAAMYNESHAGRVRRALPA